MICWISLHRRCKRYEQRCNSGATMCNGSLVSFVAWPGIEGTKPQKHLAVRHLLKIDMSAQSTTSQLKRHFVSVRSKGGSTQWISEVAECWIEGKQNGQARQKLRQEPRLRVPRSKNHWNILKHTETEVRSRGDKLHQRCSTPFAINSQVSQVSHASQVAFDTSGCFLMSFDVCLMSFALPAKRHSAGSC